MVKKVGNSLAERHFFLFRMFFCNPIAFGNHTLFQANQFNAVLLNFFLIGFFFSFFLLCKLCLHRSFTSFFLLLFFRINLPHGFEKTFAFFFFLLSGRSSGFLLWRCLLRGFFCHKRLLFSCNDSFSSHISTKGCPVFR